MRIEWEGEGVDEVGVDAVTGRKLVRVDPRYFRPSPRWRPCWEIPARPAKTLAGCARERSALTQPTTR